MPKGTVIIQPQGGGKDVFVHISVVRRPNGWPRYEECAVRLKMFFE